MTKLLDSRNLATALKPYHMKAQESFAGNKWNISISLSDEDFVWLGTAIAISENSDDTCLKVLRYGPTAEEALNACLSMMEETIIAFEGRREEKKERIATFQAGFLDSE